LPKDKPGRQAKIAELEKELELERIKLTKSNKSLIPLEQQLRKIREDEKEVGKVLKRKSGLLAVLGGNTATAKITDPSDGQGKILSSINISINDYANPGSPVTDTTHTNVKSAVDYAETFLSAIKDTAPNPEIPPHKTSLPENYFDNRVYQTRRSVKNY